MDYKILLLAIIATALLIVLTQIITEVLKTIVAKDNRKYNIVTLITAIVLTILTYVIISCINNYAFVWYYFIAAVIYGIFIAYGAMFGYDKLIKQLFNAIKEAYNTYNSLPKEKERDLNEKNNQ